MARLDAVRRRISLSDDEFETLRLVHNGDPVADEARRALLDAGIVSADGDLAPLVLDLVRTVSGPMIECAIETAGPQGPASALLAVREETVWYTDPWPQDDATSVTYCQDELPQVLWILARLIGLRRREVPRVATPFTVPLRAIDAVVQTMALSDDAWEPARVVATAQLERFFGDEIADEDRTMLMATLSFLESTARVTMVWGPQIDTDARGLALWDCGPGGYWVREQPAEPLRSEDITPDTPAVFRPVSGGEVWRLLGSLLPSSADLRAVLDRIPAP